MTVTVTRSLGDIVRDNAYKHAMDLAYVCGADRITFGAHGARALRLADALHRLGFRHQDRVAVMSQNGLPYIETFSAAQLTGLVVATVNFRLAAPEVRHIVRHSMPKAFLFEAQYTPLLEEIRDDLPDVEHFVCIGNAPDWAVSYEDVLSLGEEIDHRPSVRADDIMHIIYTSGTTGLPKGVMRSHHAELRMAEMMITEVGLLAEDHVQIMMPLFHVGARWLQLGAQLRAARMIVHRGFDPAEVITAIERERVSLTHMAPTIVQRVLDHPDAQTADLSSLRTVYYSAAPMPLPTLRRGLGMLGSVFVQLYGMTEGFGTTLAKRQHLPDGTNRQAKWLGSVGQAPYTVELRIVDDHGAPVSAGQPGEIVTRTDTRMSGYWNDSVATANAVRDDWYHTGDVGYLDEEGFLYLVDRKKDMIISGGENIYCGEVEKALEAHPGVAEVAVFGQPDPKWGEIVVAAVVAKHGHRLEDADLIEHCRKLIASYKKPRRIVHMEELPRLNTGKVDKKKLRADVRQDA